MNHTIEIREWEKKFDEKFATTGSESGLGFSHVPQPTTASIVVKEFIRETLAREVTKARQEGADADPIKQFCDRWYLVVSDLKVITYHTELPQGWGLIFAENGELHTMIEAPKLENLQTSGGR